MNTPVYNYLEAVGAVGKERAVPMKQVEVALHYPNTRAVRKQVAWERNFGKCLICNNLSNGGGYYIATNYSEILEMKKRLEKGFISRANAVRVFRNACRQHDAAGHKEPIEGARANG